MNRRSIWCRIAIIALTSLTLKPLLAADPLTPAGYPARPIRLIAPTPPGSPPDAVARVLSDRLSAALGQPVLVENRPGATGTVGLQAVASAPADGYTFGVLAMPFVVAPNLMPPLGYDTQKDLVPVGQVVWAANILVVHASSPLRTLDELVATAKARPGELTYASGGNGTPAHLGAALLAQRAGAPMRHVPFKGAPEGVAAVLGGHVDMMFAAAGAVVPQIKAGRLRALGTSAPKRLAAVPEVPTIAEQGYPGFDIRDWQGIVAPVGTPVSIVAKMSDEIGKIAMVPEVRQRFEAMGMEGVEQHGPEAFGLLIRSEISRWSKAVREAGIRAE